MERHLKKLLMPLWVVDNMDSSEKLKLSAIVLVYNSENYLEDCLDSLS